MSRSFIIVCKINLSGLVSVPLSSFGLVSLNNFQTGTVLEVWIRSGLPGIVNQDQLANNTKAKRQRSGVPNNVDDGEFIDLDNA